MELTEPKTLIEAIRHFSDPDVTLKTMVALRWPDGLRCPVCGRDNPRFIRTRSIWECRVKHFKRRFSAKTGTIFEDSPLGLDKWFTAIWLLTNAKNGISSYELHRAIGVTQKSAWFMLHRVRLAMHTGSFLKTDGGSGGEYEADETFIGGLGRNMHKKRREKFGGGRGPVGKDIVMGILNRGTVTKPSKIVRARRVPNTTREVLHAEVRAAVEPGSKLYTDELRSYRGLSPDYLHETVDHTIEYVNGRVHTNGMENFWSLFKRGLKGTYTHMSAPHLDKYVDEQVLRFNHREENDGSRFRIVLSSVVDKRLTYRELTGNDTSKTA
jgi:transposase-like protein